jgi:hypothetical protein
VRCGSLWFRLIMKRLIVLLLTVCLGPVAAQTVATTANSSVTITTGNTFQQVLAAVTNNDQCRSLTIQNNNASDSGWIFLGPTASATFFQAHLHFLQKTTASARGADGGRVEHRIALKSR